MKPIRCPACGSIGYPSDVELFEIRGQVDGKPVRKCTRCGSGLFVRPLHKPQVIPHNLWVRMQELWQAEFERTSGANTVVNYEPSEMEGAPTDYQMAISLFDSAQECSSADESFNDLARGAVLLMANFCKHDGNTPRESAIATVSYLQDIGLSFEEAIAIARTAGVPLEDDGMLSGYNGPFEPTPFHMTSEGWKVTRNLVLEEWNRCAKAGMGAHEAITQIQTGKYADILATFSGESRVTIFRLAGLPVDEMVEAIGRDGSQEEAWVPLCLCGCGEAIPPQNEAYVNNEHRGRHSRAS